MKPPPGQVEFEKLLAEGFKKEQAGDLEGALADYREAAKTIKTKRLADKIAELEEKLD